ncbi:N-acetyltransferase [Dysgonomonas sp. 25]|nr:N-acetyltransferase [Dysgonomonas sp. 25]
MILRNLDINNPNELSFVEKLYTESFPHSERRPLDRMLELYADSDKFVIQVIVKDDIQIGFLTFWHLSDFTFAEHFAIAPEARNEGVGGEVMKSFMAEQTMPIVLEVELPTTLIADRRIGFYQRLGYKLWESVSYYQPPYHAGYNPIAMYLMSFGEIDVAERFMSIKEELYTEVYEC